MAASRLSEIVARALAEDLGSGDVTSEATVPEGARGRARIVQKQPGVVFGLAAVAEAMRQCGVEDVDNLVVEGQWREEVPAEVVLAEGPARALLAAERTALNFLGHLSGIATLTARFVEAVAGTGAAHPRHPQDDPRPARPGEGGGRRRRRPQPPHRPLRRDPDQGEPHRAGGQPRQGGPRRPHGPARARGRGRVPQPRRGRLRARHRRRPAAARQHGHRRRCARRSACATRTRPPARAPRSRPRAASTCETVRGIAETGVDFISVGALTHSAPTLDFSLLIEPA